MKKPRIGFIGMGVMGMPMAGHLAAAGYAVTVYDSQRKALEKALKQIPAAAKAQTPAQVAQASDIVITMVPNGRVVQQVALADKGLIEGFKKGSLLLDTSSSEPWLTLETAKALAAIGVDMVDAPVSGAQAGAQTADLVFMVGAQKASLTRVRPILARLGHKLFHLGPVGSGHMMKCLNNLITAMTFMATTEALAIGKRLSFDPQTMIEVLNSCTAMSWISQTQFHRHIFNRKFDDPFKLTLMLKDIGIALDLAESKDMTVFLSSIGRLLWQAAARDAQPGASISAMVRWVEKTTGVRLDGGPDRKKKRPVPMPL